MPIKFPKHVPHKLHLVTLVGSGIRRPYWEKRCLKELGLTRRLMSVVLKNTPQINERLEIVKRLITVKPITLASSDNISPISSFKDSLNAQGTDCGELRLLSGTFLDSQGVFDLKKYEEYLSEFSDAELEETLSKPKDPKRSVLLNRDFEMEEEALITDKGDRIELYFQRKTFKTLEQSKRQSVRKVNRTKY